VRFFVSILAYIKKKGV